MYFTYGIEWIWGKKRILEVYVNVVEWGHGIYGIEEASQYYFHKSASKLTTTEAARLAAVLPNPRRWSPAKPTQYIVKRSNSIKARARSISLRSIKDK
jgi:monofunctional biosynthetic peptidoglycan transglycosylase